MQVFVIEVGEYDTYVGGVAATFDAAVAYIKTEWLPEPPAVVKWDDVVAESDGKDWHFKGHFDRGRAGKFSTYFEIHAVDLVE